MDFRSVMAVGVGAGVGAWGRWRLATLLNPLFPTLPLGTLSANWIGAFLMGLALGYFSHYEALSPEMRLFVTTGFLGGLTTFSTFSAETVTLIARREFTWVLAALVLHVAGSLLMTGLGILSVKVMVRA